MQSKMEQFKEFVKVHPGLREEVRQNRRTWQSIYEEWVLYGEENVAWNNFKIQKADEEISLEGMNLDSIKNIVGYIQKLNPDKIQKTLNSFQKVIQIAQSVGGGKKLPPQPGQMFNTMYNDWWD